jgi:hypothetical protein
MEAMTGKLLGYLACAVAAVPAVVPGIGHAKTRPSAKPVVFAVSPDGDDAAAGTADAPFHTPERAQKAVRLANGDHDVVVRLADGVYRLSQPLRFAAEDGGRNDHTVVWQAADGAHPVLTGAVRVTGWKAWDEGRDIYVADVPPGTQSRQLWVDGALAPVASVEVRRKDYTFTREGMKPSRHAPVHAELRDAGHLELRAVGFFTYRIAPVARVADDGGLVMRQPAWDNNLWGYDTVEKPFHPELQHLYLANALALLSAPGQWYVDPEKGKLYVRPADDVDMTKADVELPVLATLLSVGGTYDAPVRDLTFRGLRFSHTTWTGPSTDEGYANQQSGTFLAGRAASYPADPIATSARGSAAFETVRNEWCQTPAAVQVSAAERVHFDANAFDHLGQYALGIGNDADAVLTGIGLGTSDVTVTANAFTDCAGGAIEAGGVRRDAHHPSDPRMINQGLVIRNNRVRSVSKDYADNTAVLVTYVAGAVILHNDISDVPYDAIDIGFGWGMNDPGGNANYRARMHGYDAKQNLVYATPTTHRDVVVAGNRIHEAKTLFHDGGAIYNLSASPGTLITENYISDIHGSIGLYLDEGSRYITVRKNVVDDPHSRWLNINTIEKDYPVRISPDNTADDNWHNSAFTGGMWTDYQNDLILNDHLIQGDAWPPEAMEIMSNAGIEPTAGPVTFEEKHGGGGEEDEGGDH